MEVAAHVAGWLHAAHGWLQPWLGGWPGSLTGLAGWLAGWMLDS
jgi:hypothetical protein